MYETNLIVDSFECCRPLPRPPRSILNRFAKIWKPVQQPGPGPAGSWAGPAWFKMLLGLGGNQGGGGGERGNFMYLKYNFSLVP